MKPKDFFKVVDSSNSQSQSLCDGRLTLDYKKLIRYSREYTVVYSHVYIDTISYHLVYNIVEPLVEVPLYQDYAFRTHLTRHGYTIFSLTI